MRTGEVDMKVHQNTQKAQNNAGFTLIEIIMVIILIAILATIGITQFTDFSSNAKNNSTKANLQTLRRGISAQNGNMRMRCGVVSSDFPPLDSIQANDITVGAAAACTTTQISNPGDRPFVQGGIPPNPWSLYHPTSITACAGAGCNFPTSTGCSGAFSTSEDGWCYNVANGQIWAASTSNGGTNTTAAATTENFF